MKNHSFKATVNDHFEYMLESSSLKDLDILQLSEDSFHLIDKERSLKVNVLETDFQAKQVTLDINGEYFQVKIEDQMDLLVKKMGLKTGIVHKIKEIKAPMPGLVLDILVEEGQKIEKGQGLLILEAMKMENVIKAAGEGTIKQITVEKGTAVDKGKMLIELE